MRKLFPLALALLACGGSRPARTAKGDAVLSVTGRVEHGPYTYGREDLKRVSRRAFRAIAPASDAPAKFDGAAIAALIADTVDLKPGVDTAVFHGEKGYAVPVSMSALRQLKPILADMVDGKPVASWRDGAGPLVLAWPNVDQPGIDTDPRMRWWWVTSVSKVELLSWTATYGKALRVPAGSSDDARLGADAFAVQCMGCHKLRGVGGSRGPDLTQAAAKKDPQELSASMRDHLARVAPPGSEPAVASLRQIAAFLHEIDVAGSRSDEEFQAPEQPAGPRPGQSGPYGPPPRAGDDVRR
jgi:mono/diheme cytochrome c family protein